jgi:hypothetical protein
MASLVPFTNVSYPSIFPPESDGQKKRVNQVIEDMLRMHVMDNHQNGKTTYT